MKITGSIGLKMFNVRKIIWKTNFVLFTFENFGYNFTRIRNGPDPHSSKMLDPDPHWLYADPKHWFELPYFVKLIYFYSKIIPGITISKNTAELDKNKTFQKIS
jgi:hypothetical protein